jgi:hypothetical protein
MWHGWCKACISGDHSFVKDSKPQVRCWDGERASHVSWRAQNIAVSTRFPAANHRSTTQMQQRVHAPTTTLFSIRSCLAHLLAPTCVCRGRAYCLPPTPRRRSCHRPTCAPHTNTRANERCERNVYQTGRKKQNRKPKNGTIQISPPTSRGAVFQCGTGGVKLACLVTTVL